MNKLALLLLSALTLTLVSCGWLLTSQAEALQVDIRKVDTTVVLSLQYYNNTGTDQPFYIAGKVLNSLVSNVSSGTTLEVTDIQNTYPMRYVTPVGLTEIRSGDIKTNRQAIKASDAAFISAGNELSFVITPNSSNRCGKLPDVKGCVWDIGKKNQWNPDTLSCLEAAELVCGGSSFVGGEVNVLEAGMGGKIDITLKVRGSLDRETLYHFPVLAYQYTPATTPARSANLADSVTVFLTERAVISASTPAFSSSSVSNSTSSSSSASSTISSSAVSSSVSSSSVSGSSVSSFASSVAAPLTQSELSKLTITCSDGVISTTTNCTFALPPGKSLPNDLRIGIGTGVTGACTALGQQVECKNIPTGNAVGERVIALTLSGITTTTPQTTTIVAKVEDLVRTGAGDTSYLVFLFAFVAVTAIALIVVNQPKKDPSVRL